MVQGGDGLLSREECLAIMDLKPEASSYDIENRYTTLIKRYRGQNSEEAQKELDQITVAYQILTDRFIEREPEDPRLDVRVLGKTRRQWQNIWYYGRIPLLAAILGLSFVGYLIYSAVTNEPPDFQIVAAGPFASAEDIDEKTSAYVSQVLPEVENLSFQLVPLDLRTGDYLDDPAGAEDQNIDMQNQYAYVMKMLTLLAAEKIDLFILDALAFNEYAAQGAFLPLDDFYETLDQLPEEAVSKIVAQRRIITTDDEYQTDPMATPTPGPSEASMNENENLAIYGLEVTDLDLAEGLGLYGHRQIVAIGFRTERLEQTETLLRRWISDYELMTRQKEAYDDYLIDKYGE